MDTTLSEVVVYRLSKNFDVAWVDAGKYNCKSSVDDDCPWKEND